MQLRAMFRVGVWAPSVRHPGEHLGPYGRGMGPRGPLERCATPPPSLFRLGLHFPVLGVQQLMAVCRCWLGSRVYRLCPEVCVLSLLPFSRCTNAAFENNELLVLSRCHNLGRSGYIRGGSGAEGCTQSEGTAARAV